jgi:hypothetical protein
LQGSVTVASGRGRTRGEWVLSLYARTFSRGGISPHSNLSRHRTVSREVAWLGREATLHIMLIAFLVLTLSAHASVAAAVGSVSRVEKQAQVGATPAAVGMPVHMNDELTTGPKARLEVIFTDGTKLALGENAKVVVDRYVFNPANSVGELALSTSVAAFRLTTGKLNEMQNRKVNVSTPFAALAVRGTDFWWGEIDGQRGVLLVNNSRVDVSRDRCDEKDQGTDNEHKKCKCKVTLNRPGWGTDISPEGCPGDPYQWPPGKVAAALSSTTFGLALLGPSSLIPAAAAAGVVGGFIGSTAGGNGGGPHP